MIQDNEIGVLLNRNPTISYGSILYLRVSDVKRDYKKFFANAEETPHLRSHFTDEHYIKHKLGEVFLL